MEEKKESKNEEEKRILDFWKDKKIYEKSKKKNAAGKKFYLMDGPPYATGHIHMGTALNKILKDIAFRNARMKGMDVFDRAGYDTHGLPIEFQVEKEMGFKVKKEIESFGVKKFIEKCKEYATKHIGLMNSEFENLGVWMDFKNPYLTLNPEYIEKIWETFKKADEKKLLYLGKYPIHVCPRCETAVSYNEIEYAKLEDNSIFVKFKLRDSENSKFSDSKKSKDFPDKNAYLLVWTTTPWTLPGNTGVMVNPDFEYAEVEIETDNGKENWIVAKDLVDKIMTSFGHKHKVKKVFKGKEMEGWKYFNPLIEHLKLKIDKEKNYKVVLSKRYVNLEEGTGLVHSAPGHGKEDYEVGKEYGLDMPSPVGMNGLLTEEAGKYAGKMAREVDKEIITDLDEGKMLARVVPYSHDYPLCWRCKSPLLMIALPQWFFKISEIQKKLIKENEETSWLPNWMKLRMNAWLEGISDWPVSRKRYWGTPLPIWVCEKCKEKKVIGSIAELEKLSGKKIKEVHKPEIDSITIKCKCGGEMKRVEEVLDVWFDSGVSSWAVFDNEKDFKKFWPADLNIEGKDQIRGWWNSQLILSEIRFGKKPFENVSVHGLVLDLGKRKMSKSLGNTITPQEIIEKYGRDYIRYYFAKISKGEDFAFDEKEFAEIEKAFRVLININNFANQLAKGKKISIEDKWIESKMNSLLKEVTESYNNYKYYDAVQLLENFFVNDLSKGYIQVVRERSDEIYETVNEIRINLLKLLAPIIPFTTEKIWQELKAGKIVKEESIHLSAFPVLGKINEKLEKEFDTARKIIESGLRERDKAQIGLRWPLASAKVVCKGKISKEIEGIIARQLNVKEIKMEEGELKVELDTKMTPELEAEGFAREISRSIQAARKKAGLIKTDLIELEIESENNFIGKISAFKNFIKERTNSKSVLLSEKAGKKYKDSAEVMIKDIKLKVYFNKL